MGSDCDAKLENVRSILGPMTAGRVHRRAKAHNRQND